MSDQDYTPSEKRCYRCKQIKPLTEFYKNKSAKDGHQNRCKACSAEYGRQYRATEHGRAKTNEWARKYRATERVKQYRHEYKMRPDVKARERANANKRLKTPKGQKKQNRYNSSQSHLDAVHRYQAKKRKDPEFRLMERARNSIAVAVYRGKMKPASDLFCVQCGNPAQEYHHHLGYEREHWHDVIPVCRECHSAIHRIDSP
jgi:hypothetical protein